MQPRKLWGGGYIEDKLLKKRNCCGFYGNIVDKKEKFFHFQSFPFLSSLWMHVDNAKRTYAELQFRTEDSSHQTYIDDYHKMLTNFKLLQSESSQWGSSIYLQGDEEHIFVRSTKGGKLKKMTKAEFDQGKEPTRTMSLKDKKLQRQNSYSKERERKTGKRTRTSMVCAGCNTTLINLGTYVKRQSTAKSLKTRLESQNNQVGHASEELKKIVEIKKTLGDKQGEEEARSELALLDSIDSSKDISTALQRLIKTDKERESFTYVKGHGCINKSELKKEQRDVYEFVEKERKTSIMGGTWQMTVIDDSGSEKTVDLPKKCIDCQCCSIESELLNPLLKLIFEDKQYNIALHASQPLEPTDHIREILERRRKEVGKVPHVPEWALWLDITDKQKDLVKQIKEANEKITEYNKKEDTEKLTKGLQNTIEGLENTVEGLEKELENTITEEQTRLYDEVNAIVCHQVLKVSSVNKHVHQIMCKIRDIHHNVLPSLRSAIEAATEFMKLMEECGSKEISRILERSKYVDKTLLNSNWLRRSKKDGADKKIAESGLEKLQDYVEEHKVFIGVADSVDRKNKFDRWVKRNFCHEIPEGILDQQYSFENCIEKFTSKGLTKGMMSDEGDDVLTSRAFFNMKLSDARMRVNIREHISEIERIEVFKVEWKNRLQLICSFCALFGISIKIGSKSFNSTESLGEDGKEVKNAIATLDKKKWDGGDEGSWTKLKFHVFRFDQKENRTLNSKFFMRVNELMDQLHDIPVDKHRIAGIPYNNIADKKREKQNRVETEFGKPRRIAAIEVINKEGVLSGLRVYFEYRSATDGKKSDLDSFFHEKLEFKEDSTVCFEGVLATNMRAMKPDGTFDAFDTNAAYSKLIYIGTRSENRGYFTVPKKRTLQYGTVWQSKETGQVSGQDAIVGTKQKRVVGTNKKTEEKIDCRVLEFELADKSARIQWEPIYDEDEMDIGELMVINKTPFTPTPITRDMINVSKSLLPEFEKLFDEEQTAKEEERNPETVNETNSSLDKNRFIVLHRWLSAYIYKLFGEMRKARKHEFLMYQQHR